MVGTLSIVKAIRAVKSRRFRTTTLPVTVLLIAGISFLTLFAWAGRDRAIKGLNDFLPFYAGGRLAFSGALYDQERVLTEERLATGVSGENLHFIRPPWFAAALWPIAQLDFSHAHLLWEVTMAAAIAAFVLRWHPAGRVANALMLCFSLPALLSIMSGQDVPLLLLWMTGAVALHRDGRLFAAGLILALCQTKFHLFLPVWLGLAVGRRWRVLAGMIAGNVILAAASFAVAGARWPFDYIASITRGAVTVGTEHMPTLHYLLASLPMPWAWTMLCGAAVFTAASLAGRRFDFEMTLAVSPALMIPVVGHTYAYDALLLSPMLMILVSRGRTASRILAVALLTPVPWVLCLVGHPWSLVAPALLIASVVLALSDAFVDRRVEAGAARNRVTSSGIESLASEDAVRA